MRKKKFIFQRYISFKFIKPNIVEMYIDDNCVDTLLFDTSNQEEFCKNLVRICRTNSVFVLKHLNEGIAAMAFTIKMEEVK